MKKTVKINISGVFFNIDEDAYHILQNYLAHVNRKFSAEQEGKEIISDIELRIAEILQSKINNQKQVISKEDIDEVIEIMGKPEDFDNEDTHRSANTYSRRLYRDPDNRVLGGVCSGMASYFNIDPVIVRLIFVVMLFISWGVVGLIYIVLWALLPPAYTTAEKLEMRGENFSISDIEKNVRNEFETVKSNLNNYRNSRSYNRTRNFIDDFFRAIGQIILVFLKVIGGIIGFAMVVAGVGLLIGLTGWIVVGEPLMPWNNIFVDNQLVYTDMLHSFLDPNTIWLFFICVLLIVFIPLVVLIYTGLKLLLRFKINDKPFAIIGFTVWIISIVIVTVLSFSQVKKLSVSVRDKQKVEITKSNGKALYLKTNKTENAESSKFYIFDSEFSVTYDKENNKILYALPEIDIVRAYDQNVLVEVEKIARGINHIKAEENAQNINYICQQLDSILIFDAFYPLVKDNIWTFPNVNIKVRIPDGCIIYIDESIVDQLDYIDTKEYYSRRDMVNKYWIMTDEGLEKYF